MKSLIICLNIYLGFFIIYLSIYLSIYLIRSIYLSWYLTILFCCYLLVEGFFYFTVYKELKFFWGEISIVLDVTFRA